MASFNKAILVGRLTRDPEMKFTPQGTPVCKFSIAVDRGYGDKKDTDFFNIVAWQKLAEICEKYLGKGSLVLIEGEIQSRIYQTKDGQNRNAFEIIARNMKMLGGKTEKQECSKPGPAREANYQTTQEPEYQSIERAVKEVTEQYEFPDIDNDMPF